MSAERPRAVISAVASYLPEGVLTNEMLVADVPEWTPERIEDKTGIRSRHIAADGEFSSDMATRACERLFEEDESRREGIDFIVLVSVTPDYLLPFSAASVQTQLGLPTDVGALDVMMACSGYVYGLTMVGALIESGRAKRVLLITADRYTAVADEAVIGTKVLFGDAATVSLVEASTSAAPVSGGRVAGAKHGTDGSGGRHLIIPTSGVRGFLGAETSETSKPTFVMDGPEVFDFTLRSIGKHVKGALADCDLTLEDVDLFIFHQANLFMIEHLRRRLRIPKERFVVFLAEVGNTASSTIPLALEDVLRSGRVQPGNRVMLVGFGTGYSWGSVLLEYPG